MLNNHTDPLLSFSSTYHCGSKEGLGSVLGCARAWSSVVQTSLFSEVMHVPLLSCGEESYLFLEVCWETVCMYGRGDVTPKPGSAVQVQGQS